MRTIEIRDRTGRVIGTKEVVTYPGLLSMAHEEGLQRVATELVQAPSDENGRTAIAKAEIETTKGHFEALGDASPENVNSVIVPHLIRMAETRAKARALRDAVNVGIVSFEELEGDGLPNGQAAGGASGAEAQVPAPPAGAPAPPRGGNGSVPMTEAQRRYLFRILAGQGLSGEAAHEKLKSLFGAESLKGVTKPQATSVIDQLLGGGEERDELPY
jgi:hypothetical protein